MSQTATGTRALGQRFAGRLIGPADADYDATRRVFNAMIDERPELIARCAGAADVRAAVDYARDRGIGLSVLGGGHSFAGHAVRDGALMIDLRAMTEVRIDPRRRRARVQPGVTWARLDRETQSLGLAVTGGRVSSTGVIGLTLGGGSGWLERRLGATAESMVAADVVTADGRLLHADERKHPELLWALRGGGGNFGVVTSVELELHPVGPLVLAGQLLHSRDRAADVLAFVGEFMADAPDELGLGAALVTTPDAPFVPESVRGRPALGITVAYAGDHEAGETALAPLRAFAPPIADTVDTIPYARLQRLLDLVTPPGRRYYPTAACLSALSGPAIAALIDHAAAAPGPHDEVVLLPGGGVLARARDRAPRTRRNAAFSAQVLAQWTVPEDDEREIAWARAGRIALEGYGASAGYLNFDGDPDNSRVRAAYDKGDWAALREIKGIYDPDNVFRANHNIPPPDTRPSEHHRPDNPGAML